MKKDWQKITLSAITKVLIKLTLRNAKQKKKQEKICSLSWLQQVSEIVVDGISELRNSQIIPDRISCYRNNKT